MKAAHWDDLKAECWVGSSDVLKAVERADLMAVQMVSRRADLSVDPTVVMMEMAILNNWTLPREKSFQRNIACKMLHMQLNKFPPDTK